MFLCRKLPCWAVWGPWWGGSLWIPRAGSREPCCTAVGGKPVRPLFLQIWMSLEVGCLTKCPHLLTGRPWGNWSITLHFAAWKEPGARSSLSSPQACCGLTVLFRHGESSGCVRSRAASEGLKRVFNLLRPLLWLHLHCDNDVPHG